MRTQTCTSTVPLVKLPFLFRFPFPRKTSFVNAIIQTWFGRTALSWNARKVPNKYTPREREREVIFMFWAALCHFEGKPPRGVGTWKRMFWSFRPPRKAAFALLCDVTSSLSPAARRRDTRTKTGSSDSYLMRQLPTSRPKSFFSFSFFYFDVL